MLLRYLKILDTGLKITLLNYQNNYIGSSSTTSKTAKSFDILVTNLSVLYNYCNSSTRLFADLYLAKHLDIPTKKGPFQVW